MHLVCMAGCMFQSRIFRPRKLVSFDLVSAAAGPQNCNLDIVSKIRGTISGSEMYFMKLAKFTRQFSRAALNRGLPSTISLISWSSSGVLALLKGSLAPPPPLGP